MSHRLKTPLTIGVALLTALLLITLLHGLPTPWHTTCPDTTLPTLHPTGYPGQVHGITSCNHLTGHTQDDTLG